MPLRDHLREFVRRILISAIAITLAAVVGYFLAPLVLDALRVPIEAMAKAQNAKLIYTSVTGAFDLRIKIALTLAVLVSSPIWLYQIFAFLIPGLTKRETRFTLGFFLSAVPLFLAGAFAGWLLFPHMVQVLASFSADADATYLEAGTYYDFVSKLVLVVGVAFVLPVFIVLLNLVGILSGKAILGGWRVAVISITLFTAIATPAADPISMFILAIPMVVLYIAAAIIALLHDRRVDRALRAGLS